MRLLFLSFFSCIILKRIHCRITLEISQKDWNLLFPPYSFSVSISLFSFIITSLLNCSSPSLLPCLFFPPGFQSDCHLPFLPQPRGNSRLSAQPATFSAFILRLSAAPHTDVFRMFPPLRPHALLLFHSLVQITHLVISPLLAYWLDFSVSLFNFKIKIIIAIQRMLLKTQHIAIWKYLRTRIL